jgi:hypothetical protein
MALTQGQVLKSTKLLVFSGAVGGGGTVTQPKVDVFGFTQVVGNYNLTGGATPALGFPRIRQSADGVTFSNSFQIPQDLTQGGTQYPFNVEVRAPYIAIELTLAVGGAVDAVAQAIVTPTFGQSTGIPFSGDLITRIPPTASTGVVVVPLVPLAAGTRIFCATMMFYNTGVNSHIVTLLSTPSNTPILQFPLAPFPGGAFILDGRGDVQTNTGEGLGFAIDAVAAAGDVICNGDVVQK